MSWLIYFRFTIVLVGTVAGLLVSSLASDDPEEDWISAFGWIQTGEQLGKAEHWPLALGSLMEAHRKLKQMQVEYPAYEVEIIEYRIERLEEEIEGMQGSLASGDQALMVKFVDFAESFETGLDQRFNDQFVEAMNTLDVAKALLDEIVFENPKEYRDAVASQYELLESSLTWLDGQINFRERERQRGSTFVGDGVDWGTTQFVKLSDLPTEGSNILMSAELFPGFLKVEGLEERGSDTVQVSANEEPREEKEESGGSAPRFRMSSKQSVSPTPAEKTEVR
ncbi:MAG: hypothetical protein AAF733_03535 [Verrucomicrobiota bacterium]